MKELRVEVPEGYEIDKESSTFECIKFKKKKQVDIKTWNDLCEASVVSDKVRVSGYCLSDDSKIYMAHRLYAGDDSMNVFATEKEARSALAMAQISQLMPYYGGAITKEEWNTPDITKFTIERFKDGIWKDTNKAAYYYIAFHTEEQRDSFLNNNYRLVKDYLMLD